MLDVLLAFSVGVFQMVVTLVGTTTWALPVQLQPKTGFDSYCHWYRLRPRDQVVSSSDGSGRVACRCRGSSPAYRRERADGCARSLFHRAHVDEGEKGGTSW